MTNTPFWKTKSLEHLDQDEWEALCDGCAICCLEKVEWRGTGKIRLLPVSCSHLNTATCRCKIYRLRHTVNPHCLKLGPEKLTQLNWLPQTCAYRTLAEGRDLEWWHPLISGDSNTVHEAGISIKNRVLPGEFVHPEDLLQAACSHRPDGEDPTG